MKSRQKCRIYYVCLITMLISGIALYYATRPFVAPPVIKGNELKEAPDRSMPLEQMLKSDMQKNESDALYVIQENKQIAAIGETDTLYNVASIRKSIISALFGIAEKKGLIDLDETLGEIGVDDRKQPLTKQEKSAKVRHLLQARSGIYLDALGESQRMKALRPKRTSHAPGTFYYYNNWDFNMLGVIFEQQTKMKVGEAFEKWIAVPTDMRSFDAAHVVYERGNETSIPMYRFYLSAEDLARFGALYAQEGRWNGKEIIPNSWIEASSTPYSSIKDVDQFTGYGYLWWLEPASKHPLIWGVGSGGQFLIVDRKNNMAIALLNDTGTSPLSSAAYRFFGQESTYTEARNIHAVLTREQ